jgi:hypothetical protein
VSRRNSGGAGRLLRAEIKRRRGESPQSPQKVKERSNLPRCTYTIRNESLSAFRFEQMIAAADSYLSDVQ